MAAANLVSGTSVTTIPSKYILSELDRPKLSQVIESNDNIPVIDLALGDDALITKQMGEAAREYGFFQIINHDVPKEVVEGIIGVAREFFSLPVEEKMKLCSDDTSKPTRLSTSFNLNNESAQSWRDYLRIQCYPLEKNVDEWPSVPSSFKDIVSNYYKEVRQVAFKLEEYLSKSLGLEKDSLKTLLGEDEQGQHMTINYYPPCPQPDLTLGIPPHTDPNTLTILLPDTDVSGLQVLKDGKWMAVKPCPGAFIINIGDQLQAMSNGQYKSVWHRAIVNIDKPRISIPSFICPSNTAKIRAPDDLISKGQTAQYTEFTFAEYYDKFWKQRKEHQHGLDLFKN
nr:BX6 [Aphelandra squarrosa]